MTSEVCPFCGKTYKRLKSHLPHCKAAANSRTTLHEPHVKTNEAPSHVAAGISEPAAKVKKSTQPLSAVAGPQSKKSKKVSAVSSAPETPFRTANTSSLSQASSLSSPSPPTSAKKKKQKLSEQIRMADMPPSLSPSPTVSKPKRKSLRASIEAAKSDQVMERSQEGTRSTLRDLPSGPDPLRSTTTAGAGIKMIPDAPLSTDTKPKDALKKKVSKTKRAAQSLPTTKDSDSLDPEVNESDARLPADDPWVDNKAGTEELSVNNMFLKSRNGHQTRITIQDVRTTLGRVKTTAQPGRVSILSQMETNNNLSSKTRVDTGLGPDNQKDVATTKALSDLLPITSQHTELQSVQRKSSKCLIPAQRDVSSQPKLTTPAAPLLSGHLSSQASMNEVLEVGRYKTELLSISPSPVHFSSPRSTRVETPRAEDGIKLEDKKPNTAHSRTEGPVSQRSLGQVRLRELPEWLFAKTPTHPRDVMETVQRGWQWYYRRYIDVKKGGVGGVGMLLAGYCVLSYVWSYPHIKRDRWRKYH